MDVVSAKFVNFGSVHINPVKCRAIVTTETAVPRTASLLSCDKQGFMLPLESRVYSGNLDFTNVDAGNYRIAAGLVYSKEPEMVAQKQITIRVSVEGEERLVEEVRTDDSIPNYVEVQW